MVVRRPRTHSGNRKCPDRSHLDGWRACMRTEVAEVLSNSVCEANVETERSRWGLVPPCHRVGKAGRVHPGLQAHVECSNDRGVISFDWRRCMLRAVPVVMALRTEDPDDTMRSFPPPVASSGLAEAITLTVRGHCPRKRVRRQGNRSPEATADGEDPHMPVEKLTDDHVPQEGHRHD